MDTSAIVFVGIGAAVIGAAVLILRSKTQASNNKSGSTTVKARSSERPKPPVKNRFRATSIVCGEDSCAAVQAFAGKRYLVEANDIPPLPVPNCDARKCTCTYSHHADRRDEDDDRRGPPGLRSDLHVYARDEDRRKKRGRRKSDWE
jgi:uncharacterized low-complexity protein